MYAWLTINCSLGVVCACARFDLIYGFGWLYLMTLNRLNCKTRDSLVGFIMQLLGFYRFSRYFGLWKSNPFISEIVHLFSCWTCPRIKKKYLCPLLWVWYHLVKFLISHYFTVSIASLKLLTGYENVNIWGKNRSYLVCQRQVCREGSFFRFPGGGTQFPQGVDRYIDQLASVIPLDNGTVRTAQGTGCGVYRIDLNVYIQPSLLMYEFHSSILACRVYQSYFHSSYNDVFLGLLAWVRLFGAETLLGCHLLRETLMKHKCNLLSKGVCLRWLVFLGQERCHMHRGL